MGFYQNTQFIARIANINNVIKIIAGIYMWLNMVSFGVSIVLSLYFIKNGALSIKLGSLDFKSGMK